LLGWRYISHQFLLQANSAEDTDENNDDPSLQTLDDICAKYSLRDPECLSTMTELLRSVVAPRPGQVFDGDDGAARAAELQARAERILAHFHAGDVLPLATLYMVAEGNVRMLRVLVEQHGADPALGVSWGMMTYVDFAAGKGHDRVISYLLTFDSVKAEINRRSSREGITAIDRAAKAGFLSTLRLLVAHGAQIHTRRVNLQTPAHGAAIYGHTEVLAEIARLGGEMDSADAEGRTPLDLARHFEQTEAVLWLERHLGLCGPDGRGGSPTLVRWSMVSASRQSERRLSERTRRWSSATAGGGELPMVVDAEMDDENASAEQMAGEGSEREVGLPERRG